MPKKCFSYDRLMEIALDADAEYTKSYDVYFEVLSLRIMLLKSYWKIERKKYSAEIAIIPNVYFLCMIRKQWKWLS